MTTKEIVAWQAQQIAELREINAWLRSRVETLDALLEDKRFIDAQKREAWRDAKRRRRGVVLRNSEGSPKGSPEEVLQDNGGNLIGGGPTVPPVLGTSVTALEDQDGEETKNGESAERGSADIPPDTNGDWLLFRETYPKTDRTSWPVAERRFKALSKADRAAAVEGAAKYHPKPTYEKGAQSWLSEHRWETVDDAPAVLPFERSKGQDAIDQWAAMRQASTAIIEGEQVR